MSQKVVLDSTVIRACMDAQERVVAALSGDDTPTLADSLRTEIAKAILELARNGVCDADALRKGALAHLRSVARPAALPQ